MKRRRGHYFEFLNLTR